MANFDPGIEEIYTRLITGDKIFLSRGITLIESKNPEHQQIALSLLEKINPHTGQSIRLGITGPPGAGKSTLIETLGQKIIAEQKKVAVLAIDPTSSESLGSILGDKTRMENLAQSPLAYIRPSPNNLELGGVHNTLRESIMLCEAAGFEVIFIETVGVGQSEMDVKSMCDLFILVINPGAGDELQGIKKGIVEAADLIVISKSDGILASASQRARSFILQSLQILKHSGNRAEVEVINVSAVDELHIDQLMETIIRTIEKLKTSGQLEERRNDQQIKWFETGLIRRIIQMITKSTYLADAKKAFITRQDNHHRFIPGEIEKEANKIKNTFNL